MSEKEEDFVNFWRRTGTKRQPLETFGLCSEGFLLKGDTQQKVDCINRGKLELTNCP